VTFNSAEFVLFLPLVLAAYWVIPRYRRQNLLLVVASYVFYGWWDYRFLGLILISTGADYLLARGIGKTEAQERRRMFLVSSLVVNLGILGFFKYYGFFVSSAVGVIEGLGFKANPPLLELILPVGISFYTFQTISYTFDVYRRRIEPEPNLVTFAAYVAYFPQLVAGPIERASHLLPQIRSRRTPPSSAKLASALALILSGLFKKIVLADGLAPLVEARFSDPSAHGALSLLIGAYAFAIQIYGDFSGYSSIARGVSRLFGIELRRNFEQPYLSINISQFWRAWHISLSSWLKDYLYVPLGGNRRGRRKTYRNLLITMLLGGLWHGAGWSFLAWGLLHGLLLAGHRLRGAYEPPGRPPPPTRDDLGRIIGTFHAVTFAWIFFRAPSLSSAWEYVLGLGRVGDLSAPGPVSLSSALVLTIGFGLTTLVGDLLDRSRHEWMGQARGSPAVVGAAAGLCVVAILVWSGGAGEPFIYFQF
jgi:D-alanyl-lipoteichoic acid acyltransferase DltB (MBOAT superfamily)